MHIIRPRPPETVLIVGEPLLDCDELQDCLKSVNIDIPVVKHGNIEKDEVTWCRDFTVSTLDGTQIIGYNNLKEEDLSRFVAISPPISSNIQLNIYAKTVGKGILRSKEETHDMVDFMNQFQIPYRRSHCPFDGGNLLLFYDSQNKPCAIIGFHQVVLTALAFRIQGFYEKNAHRLNTTPLPSEEAYYAARNEDLWLKNRDLAVYLHRNITDEFILSDSARRYLNELFSPLTTQQKWRFHLSAINFERKFQIAKEEIAKELGIKNPIFVPNREFHVDMDLLPINRKNIVFVNDDQELLLKPIARKVHMTLINHGFFPRSITGLERREGKTLNLMNILHFNDAVIIPTSLPLFEETDRKFIEALKKEKLKIARINLPRDTVTLYDGGIHCFTMLAQSPVYFQISKLQSPPIRNIGQKSKLRDYCTLL